MEDDDDKRRRNLMTFATSVCLASFFDIELKELVVKIVPVASSVPAWKTYVAGVLADVYLVIRYVVRDREKGNAYLLTWPDWDSFVMAVCEARDDYLKRYVVSKFKAGWRKTQGGSNGLMRNDSIADMRQALESQARQILQARGSPATSEDAFHLLNKSRRSISFSDKERSGIGFPTWIAVTVEFKDQANNGTIMGGIHRTKLDGNSLHAKWFTFRGCIRIILASRFAVEVLLPYYLGILAATVLTIRFLAA